MWVNRARARAPLGAILFPRTRISEIVRVDVCAMPSRLWKLLHPMTRRGRKSASQEVGSGKRKGDTSASSAVVAVGVVRVDMTPDALSAVSTTEAKCPHGKDGEASPLAAASPPSECPYHWKAPSPAAAPPVASPTNVSPPEASSWPRAPPNAKWRKLAFPREQANVDDLLAKHATAIAALKAAIADDSRFAEGANSRIPYDDIWLLRFILSNGEGKKAEAAVRATLQFRAENAATLARCAAGEPHPLKAAMSQWSITDIYGHRTRLDEPVQLIRAGKSNVKRLMDTYTEDEVVSQMNYEKERAFIMCDDATRRTRRLVKMVTVVDMHSGRFGDNDNRFYKALGRASKESELFYPQLLAITVGINVPSYLNLIWPIAKRLMPAKTLAKFRVCGARDTTTQSVASCPFASNVFTPETLVEFLGGVGASTEILGPVDRPRVPYK